MVLGGLWSLYLWVCGEGNDQWEWVGWCYARCADINWYVLRVRVGVRLCSRTGELCCALTNYAPQNTQHALQTQLFCMHSAL